MLASVAAIHDDAGSGLPR